MEIPAILHERIISLSNEIDVRLEVTRFWADEFRPGWYCRFWGQLHESSAFAVHVAGSLAVDLSGDRRDEIDLFLFVNGDRVGRLDAPYQYLHRRSDGPFRWLNIDDGFEVQKTLRAIAMIDDGSSDADSSGR